MGRIDELSGFEMKVNKYMKPIFIITGEKGSGKTTFLLHLINLLQTCGYNIGGVLSTHDIIKDSYSIKNIQTNQEVNLMQRVSNFQQRPHHFKLSPNGVKMGNNWIDLLLDHPPQVTVIDEIGSYELSGELWSEGFTRLTNSFLPLIFTCKTKHLKAVVQKWNIEPTAIFYPNDFHSPEKAFEQMDELL